MEQSTKIRTTNYKGEEYTNLENIQSQMKKIAINLRDNFKEDKKIILVEDFRGDKAKLRRKLKEIADNPNNKKNKASEYRGIYLFAEKDGTKYNYLYTGITRKGVMRLHDHVSSNNKSSATWAYLIVKNRKTFEERIKEFHHKSKLTKKQKERKEKLKEYIEKGINIIQENYFSKLFVTFIPIKDDNFFLHMTEPYIACEFKCNRNSFETH